MSFWCCDEFAAFLEEEEFTVREIEQILDYRFCPFCAYRLASLD